MEESVASRLKLFIDTNGLTSTQFADMCGIPRPSLSQILSGRNKKISDILVGQIHRAFPDLSVVWLLFGEGPVKISNIKDMSAGHCSSSSRLGGSNTTGEDDYSRTNKFLRKDSDSSRVASSAASNEASQNRESSIVGQVDIENSILKGLNSTENGDKYNENQIFESDLKILDLKQQIERMKQNPRKVLQITIYYDDSTFETFFPK